MNTSAQKLTLISLFLVLLTSPAWGQVFYEKVEPGEFSMCAFEEAAIRETPGSTARKIGRVLFGEEVEHLGEIAFVRAENQMYIRVIAKDGSQGWVAENYLVKNGGLVAMVENAPVYEKPNTVASLTRQEFRTGELVILSDFNDQWMNLTSMRKERSGWVKGYEKVSSEDVDIEIASLLERANSYIDPSQRRLALQDISRVPGFASARLAAHVQRQLNPTTSTQVASNAPTTTYPASTRPTYSPPSYPATNPAQTTYTPPTYPAHSQPAATRPQTAATPQTQPARPSIPVYEGEYLTPSDLSALNNSQAAATNRPATTQPPAASAYTRTNATPAPAPVKPATPSNSVVLQDVFDAQTGKMYQRVKESGTFQAVQGPKKPATMYFAYHKTLPVGSKIWLEVPGGFGLVQLEVVAPLRADNPNIIGLGDECIKALFGNKTAKEIGPVSIYYPKS